MTKYDQPGYMATLPGIGSFDAAASNSEGSAGVGFNKENITPIETVGVSPPLDSVTPGVPHVLVDAGDASVPSQVILFDRPSNETFGGVVMNSGGQGPTQPQQGTGHVMQPNRPWAK